MEDLFFVEADNLVYVDTDTMTAFAILMCQASLREKAGTLIRLIVGPTGGENTKVSWNSARMKNAFKKMFFFSEIFPKKYQCSFIELLDRIGGISNRNASKRMPDQNFAMNQKLWGDEYLMLAEEQFDQVFEKIY